jgi:hypothetical protein
MEHQETEPAVFFSVGIFEFSGKMGALSSSNISLRATSHNLTHLKMVESSAYSMFLKITLVLIQIYQNCHVNILPFSRFQTLVTVEYS